MLSTPEGATSGVVPVAPHPEPSTPPTADANLIFEGSPSWKAYFWQYVGAWVLCLALVGFVWLLFLRLNRTAKRYKLTNTAIDVESGIFGRKIETLQLWRVRDIDFQQSFMERMLGIATIHVFTKDVTDPDLRITGLPSSRALFDHLKTAAEQARQSRNALALIE